ncbi:hypothetical protein MGEO_18500 [Marivita geojedonensis]|uniref:Uncharacterized protein n=2 Tax=Marivita geojedonensis TaxID=1123756 RepID=A0A1X4NDS9_9RHOB|nr:hypothetical protein MGEO_18500 [Marivita geojedonensis]
MEARAQFLIEYAEEHGPVTVRGLFYAATVAGVPGIEKTDAGYNKVQTQVLKLRREGKMPYGVISDGTRYMRRPRTYDGWTEALRTTAEAYRKSLWTNHPEQVEIWIEKSALSGVIFPVTAEYEVPLMPTGGYVSETFAHDAVENMRGTGQRLVVYSLYDFDRSGRDAEASLKEKVERFGRKYGVPVSFEPLALTYAQVKALDLPTRPAKRKTAADQRWTYPFAAELDAIPPDKLRDMVRGAIERHLPASELEHLKMIEQAERNTMLQFIGEASL